MTNRRDFLRSGAMILASGFLSNNLLNAASVAGKSKKSIGLQLYSLRDAMKVDPLVTLKEVAQIGFKTIETANYADGKIYGMLPSEFKKTTKDLGLKMTSAHLGGPNFTVEKKVEAMDWWKKAIADHKEAGVKYMVKPSMPIPKTISELKNWCDYYNAIGELTADAKIKFGFHNHAREFEKIEGEIMYDFMIQNTDPKSVFFQMDVYWVTRGGFNPVDYMTKYPNRFPVLHIKDEKEIGESGKMDFKAIYEKAYINGLEDSFVEVERYNFEPIESVRKSYDYLNKSTFVK